MPETTAAPAPSRRRLALPLTVGLALWSWAPHVLALPGVYGEDNFEAWALATRWVISTAGAALALVCAYLLARRLETHLRSRDRVPTPERPELSGLWRRSPPTVLIAVGASVDAQSELLWVYAGPLPLWVFTLHSVIGGLAAPAVFTLGVYLALRRLEDHLAGRHRGKTPKAPTAGGKRHASGLTSPYVII